MKVTMYTTMKSAVSESTAPAVTPAPLRFRVYRGTSRIRTFSPTIPPENDLLGGPRRLHQAAAPEGL